MDQNQGVSFPTKRLLLLAFLAATLVMVLNGCEERAQQPAGPFKTVNLAYATIPQTSLVQIALAKGFFAQEGLKINPQAYAFGKPALEAVLQGRADLATVAETPLVFAILGGYKIRVAAVIETSNRDLAVIARRDLGITKPRDLWGKKIAVAKGTNGEFFLDCFLTAQGMTRQDVMIINLTPDQMQPELAAGRIAAVAIWNPPSSLIKKALGEKGVVFYGEEFYTENFCIAAAPDFVKRHPEKMRRFLKALLRAEEFAREYPVESRNLCAAVIKLDPAALRAIWDDFNFRVTLSQSLLVTLEDESRWALKNSLVKSQAMPYYLDYIYCDALSSLKSERVRIIR